MIDNKHLINQVEILNVNEKIPKERLIQEVTNTKHLYLWLIINWTLIGNIKMVRFQTLRIKEEDDLEDVREEEVGSCKRLNYKVEDNLIVKTVEREITLAKVKELLETVNVSDSYCLPKGVVQKDNLVRVMFTTLVLYSVENHSIRIL